MEWLYYVGGCICLFVLGLGALFAVIMVWGILHKRQSQRTAAASIRAIELSEIPALAQECVAVFAREFSIQLDLNDVEDAAQKMDDALQDVSKLKDAFAKDDFYWYFVKPVGAFLGELMRIHARHVWIKNPGQTPLMTCALAKAKSGDGDYVVVNEDLAIVDDVSSEVHPFDKVLAITADFGGPEPGDLYAYIVAARALAEGEN